MGGPGVASPAAFGLEGSGNHPRRLRHLHSSHHYCQQAIFSSRSASRRQAQTTQTHDHDQQACVRTMLVPTSTLSRGLRPHRCVNSCDQAFKCRTSRCPFKSLLCPLAVCAAALPLLGALHTCRKWSPSSATSPAVPAVPGQVRCLYHFLRFLVNNGHGAGPRDSKLICTTDRLPTPRSALLLPL